MELIKRKILLEDSIDRNYNSSTYGTITASTFYINILLTQNYDDMGMFSDVAFIPVIGINTSENKVDVRLTGKTVESYYNVSNKLITTSSDSYLDDVKSYDNKDYYKLNFDINSESYVNYTGKTINGVNRVTYLGDPITYVFDVDKNDKQIGTTGQTSGLLYQDYATGETIASYKGEGWNPTNTSLSAITKEEYLLGITSTPTVKSDVFVDRGITTIFEKHFKLSEITNINELGRYGRGYFNVVKY